MALNVTVGVTNSCVTNNMPVGVQCSVQNTTGSNIKITDMQTYVARASGSTATDSAAAFQPGNMVPTVKTTGNTGVVVSANSTQNFSWSEVFHGQIGGTATTGQGYGYTYDVFAVVYGDDNSVNVSNKATVRVIPEDTYTGSQNSATNLQNATSPFNMPVAGQLRFDSNLVSGLATICLSPQ